MVVTSLQISGIDPLVPKEVVEGRSSGASSTPCALKPTFSRGSSVAKPKDERSRIGPLDPRDGTGLKSRSRPTTPHSKHHVDQWP